MVKTSISFTLIHRPTEKAHFGTHPHMAMAYLIGKHTMHEFLQLLWLWLFNHPDHLTPKFHTFLSSICQLSQGWGITRKQGLDLNAALYFRSELLQLGKCSLNADEFQAAKSSYLDMMSAEGFNTQIVGMIDVQNEFPLLLRRGTRRTEVWGVID